MKETSTAPNEIRYVEALARLNQIVEQIENTQIDVDELEAVVKEAVMLISACRARLSGTQTAVDEALAGLRADGDGGAD